MKKYCWIILIIVAQTGFSQQKVNQKNIGKEFMKDGQCFAKCLVETYKTHEETYPIFTGQKKKKGVRLKTKTITLKQPISNWVKKKAAINCKSPDPNDCLVWCLEEMVPGETANFKYVKNTSKTTEFEMQTFTIYKKIKSEYIEVPIVCQANVTDTLLSEIQANLVAIGYLKHDKIDAPQLKLALSNFQRDNNLPIGQFDFQTLKKLNVKP